MTTTNQSHEPERMAGQQEISLLAALKLTAHNAADGSGLCWCAVDDRVFGHSEKCQSIRKALTTAEGSVSASSDFATLWSTAPRSRTARIEREDAEWWWRQGQRSVTETVTEDLQKIQRMVSGRIER